MYRQPLRNGIFLLVSLSILNCQQNIPPPPPPPPAAGGSPVVAAVDRQQLTDAEIDATIAQRPVDERMNWYEAQESQYQVRKQMIQSILEDRMLDLEATARKITRADYMEEEIGKIPEPKARDIQDLFDRNKDRLRGQTLDQVRPRIVQSLQQQERNRRRDALIRKLEKKYGAVIYLQQPEPPVIDIAVSPDVPQRGDTDAQVTMIEFSDFQCPYCQQVKDSLDQAYKKYSGKVKHVYYNFPLTQIHEFAYKAAEAGYCANEQKKFWDYREEFFARQRDFSQNRTIQDEQARLKANLDILRAVAKAAKIDADPFISCIEAGKYTQRVQQDLDTGRAAGVSGTPAIYLNGRPLRGAKPLDAILAAIDKELGKKKKD